MIKNIIKCSLIALSLFGCSAQNQTSGLGFDIVSWNQQNAVSNPTFASVNKNVVDIKVFSDINSSEPLYAGTGVFLANTSLNGHLAVLTIRHIGDVGDTNNIIRIYSSINGEDIAIVKPVYNGFNKDSPLDSPIALEVISVDNDKLLSEITGINLTPSQSSVNMYAWIHTPFGLANGDSGSPWIDENGNLIGISGSIIKMSSAKDPNYGYMKIFDASTLNDGSSDINQSPLVPVGDYAIIYTVETSYMENLFPNMFSHVTLSDHNVYKNAFTFGYQNFMNTYKHTDAIMSNDQCFNDVGLYNYYDEDKNMSKVLDILHSPECLEVHNKLNEIFLPH
jgi:hypothetical protein